MTLSVASFCLIRCLANGSNVFGEPVHTVGVCSLGQITAGIVGKFGPMA